MVWVCRGDSNEYSQYMFLWRNKQNYPFNYHKNTLLICSTVARNGSVKWFCVCFSIHKKVMGKTGIAVIEFVSLLQTVLENVELRQNISTYGDKLLTWQSLTLSRMKLDMITVTVYKRLL